MNDKKKLMKAGFSPETPKTAFEKFEEEIKTSIFDVLFVLLKDEETTFWKYLVTIACNPDRLCACVWLGTL